jgi:hypothetical protein
VHGTRLPSFQEGVVRHGITRAYPLIIFAALIRRNADAKFDNSARNMSEGRTMLGLGIFERV